MSRGWVYLAQALDNRGPDHLAVDNVQAGAFSREQAVEQVARVMTHGRRVYQEGGVALTVWRGEFVLEVPCAERDAAGRIAPLVCHGRYGGATDLQAQLMQGLGGFAARLGRTLPPELNAHVGAAIDRLRRQGAADEGDWLAALLRALWRLLRTALRRL